MSDRDGFAGGFLAGALFGGLVGGILGTTLASRLAKSATSGETRRLRDRVSRGELSPQALQSEDDIEAARQILEAKISQLNSAIDDVRHQLHNVNGSVAEIDRPLPLPDDN